MLHVSYWFQPIGARANDGKIAQAVSGVDVIAFSFAMIIQEKSKSYWIQKVLPIFGPEAFQSS
jgi:hypothetical protein